MQEEAGGGGIVHPVDRGEGYPLSVCLARVGNRAYTTPPQKNAVAPVGRQVWRDPCRGIPFQYAKIVQMSAEYAKLA